MYCINLKRRPDRRESAQREFTREGLDVEFIDATDGGPSGLRITPSEYGCADSHIRIWRDIVAKGHPWGLVFEDDVVLAQGFKDKLDKVLSEAPEGWDIIWLGHFLRIKGAKFGNLYDARALGMHAYLISQSCAKKISVFDSLRYKTAIDNQLSCWPLFTLCTDEPIADQVHNWSSSDIGKVRTVPFDHYLELLRKPIICCLTVLLTILINYFRSFFISN